MSVDTTTRWTVSVSKKTDIALRTFLAQRGMKKGDLSKFVEEAVKWRVLDKTITEVRGKFENIDPAELQQIVDDATQEIRGDVLQSRLCE